MHLHEFQAKEVLDEFDIPTPPFRVVTSVDEIEKALDSLKIDKAVLKAQVHAGGRGKAGAVKIAKSRKEAVEWGKKLLGMKVVNHQTGSEGMIANSILITPTIEIKKEFYLGAVIDRQKKQAVIIASPEGGMEIEEIAVKKPERLITVPISQDGTIKPYHQIRLAKLMGWDWSPKNQGLKIVNALAKAFLKTDASLLEINPLVETMNGDIIALDAKLTIDDNALFRQTKLVTFFDPTQLPIQEAKAKQIDLSYIALDGTIGCMVNGAGLAMATMDIIHYYGGSPANFLDVGGGATKEKVAEGFKLLLIDPKVNAILVNIFGGIMNCATVAEGVIEAAKVLTIKVPLVVRLEGTNVEEGRRLLKESGLNIVSTNTLAEAAQTVVKLAKTVKP